MRSAKSTRSELGISASSRWVGSFPTSPGRIRGPWGYLRHDRRSRRLRPGTYRFLRCVRRTVAISSRDPRVFAHCWHRPRRNPTRRDSRGWICRSRCPHLSRRLADGSGMRPPFAPYCSTTSKTWPRYSQTGSEQQRRHPTLRTVSNGCRRTASCLLSERWRRWSRSHAPGVQYRAVMHDVDPDRQVRLAVQQGAVRMYCEQRDQPV